MKAAGRDCPGIVDLGDNRSRFLHLGLAYSPPPGVASIEHTQTPRRSPADLALAARDLNRQTLALLPAAVALVIFQFYALPRALPHLDKIGGLLVVVATLWSVASGFALLSLFSHTRRARSAASQPELEALRLRLAGTTSALLVGATADIAVAVAVGSGSSPIAAVVACALVAIICLLCW